MAMTDHDSLAYKKKKPSGEFKRDGKKQERWDKEQEKTQDKLVHEPRRSRGGIIIKEGDQ